jgi:hypothetical protein
LSNGRIKGLRKGSTTFRAIYGTFESSASVEVKDAPPQIKIYAPDVIFVDVPVVIKADVKDDTGVKEVTFSIDGASVMKFQSPPYELVYLPPADKAGKNIVFVVEAKDIDNNTSSSTSLIKINSKITPQPPRIELKSPSAGDVVIEGAPIRFSAAGSNISKVKFLVDGKVVGEVRNFVFISGEKRWEMKYTVPQGMAGSSLSVKAIGYSVDGLSAESSTVILKVAKDLPPKVDIISPKSAEEFVAGTTITVRVKVF